MRLFSSEIKYFGVSLLVIIHLECCTCMEIGASFKKSNPLSKPPMDPPFMEDLSYVGEVDTSVYLQTPQLIEKQGYRVEKHEVITKDGYILNLFRIPKLKKLQSRIKPKVVLLIHGFMGSSTDWISNSEENALAFKLANLNSDVWLANLRGNVYSGKHVFMNSNSTDYWNFSFHEMGKYDVPAMMDYILQATNEKKLYVVTHSLGCNVMFISTSLYPELNSKIKIMFALAPGVYLTSMTNPLRYVAPLAYNEQIAITAFGRGELVVSSVVSIIQASGLTSACNLGTVSHDVCISPLYALASANNAQVNTTWLPVILANYPNRVSSKTLIHLLQCYNSRMFQEYDFGYFGNMEHYNSLNPPEYHLSNFHAPIAIFSTLDDAFMTPDDIERLSDKLSNVVLQESVAARSFGHLGFLYSNKAPDLVYNKIFQLMSKY